MSEKVKFTLEYEVKSSPKILYLFLLEPNALAQWFADGVSQKESVYQFTWDDEVQMAQLISSRENKSVKYKWLDDEPYFFEMEIIQDELTNDVALSITDFAKPENITDRKLIWDNQIEYLQGVIGA
ncbi:MAG TPA: START-like domain-containing protein [Sphingobacteriaceae bacterium]|nr:START-like domain-containing protein [Sphingobacteriaceae bacterium]